MLKDKKVYLIDVRETAEYRREHIAEAHLFPKSTLDPNAIFKAAGKDASICVQCLSGGRSAQSAAILEDALSKTDAYGDIKIYDLAGGIAAWKQAGLPIVEDFKAPLPIIRQVHLIASTLIITGSLLSRYYNDKFIFLPIMVGCGLFVSGATGFCGMALVLARLPYNKS
ncbi:rhodanese domain-containing protein [Angomonas deanei]|uniref:Rhodanese domain-containing protein n=1 Tax=Angomonas deanei TaxID=59799 RepID=S9TBR9_9TRYP|nr:rhodanese domain-containing protein [Angomonas deanei]EPY15467.1 rhodanese domain-containing protein [Angomonas deanei]CAD2219860.1 Rhodanese-like domain/Protein of unknown function (DUF2892), putative [Angomonas deanei]|eukprot:EPY15453.1 rhodanese domain-containing protein [Angomonas deanei]